MKLLKSILTMNLPSIIPNPAFARLFPALIAAALLVTFLPGCATQPSSSSDASWAAPVGVGMNPLNQGGLY